MNLLPSFQLVDTRLGVITMDTHAHVHTKVRKIHGHVGGSVTSQKWSHMPHVSAVCFAFSQSGPTL